LTLLPRVFAALPPFCRSCRKLDRKDCSAAVGEVVVLDVEPPRSPMSLLNAVARLDSEVDSEFDVAPAAAAVPAPWPLLKSLIKVLSSEMTLCRPY
jgi:hypothetical protein